MWDNGREGERQGGRGRERGGVGRGEMERIGKRRR